MTLIKTSQINFTELSEYYAKQDSRRYLKSKKFQFSLFSIFMHKKLMYFKYVQKNKMYIYSNGQLLGSSIKKIKFFKKSLKNYGYTINLLVKKVSKPISSIFLFYCKNFNFKNYLWVKKFYLLLTPNINYFIVSKAWNYINKKKKRIKRKIYKRLFTATKTV